MVTDYEKSMWIDYGINAVYTFSDGSQVIAKNLEDAKYYKDKENKKCAMMLQTD